jgi:uncharacterized protein YggT (Ycf19 family)
MLTFCFKSDFNGSFFLLIPKRKNPIKIEIKIKFKMLDISPILTTLYLEKGISVENKIAPHGSG